MPHRATRCTKRKNREDNYKQDGLNRTNRHNAESREHREREFPAVDSEDQFKCLQVDQRESRPHQDRAKRSNWHKTQRAGKNRRTTAIAPMRSVTRRVDRCFSDRLYGWLTRQPALTSSVAVIVLVALSGCAGGFQGYRPVAPTITQPASITIPVGQTATFSVTATGTGAMTYQWFKNGVAISGATSSTYTTPATVAGDTGSAFTVTVTNSAGSATSGPATLTVLLPPPLAKSLVPSSTTPPYNSSVQLFPTFSGATTAVIGSHGVGSSDITTSAASGASYPTPPLTATTTYTLTVTDAKGDVVSTTCVVTPTQVTLTPIAPANQTIAPAQTSFSTTATGGATDSVSWSATAGTFSGNVWTPPTTAGPYTITATSVDEPSVFVTTTITLSAPVIMTQPASQRLCTGSVLTLSVTASYVASYQWNLNGTAIPGATSPTYSVTSAQSANVGNYSVTVTNGVGSVTSSLAAVTVGTTTILANPTSLSLIPTQTGLFTVSGQGIGQIFVPVVSDSIGWNDGVALSGATSSNYTTPPVDTNV